MDHAKTSQAGSLSTTFSEKLKIVGAKTGGGDQKELNVAIIKATTSQFHVMPKEKHVRTLKLAVHSSQPRRNVLHVITELHRRLQDATDWLTELKTLITLHRLMRESDPTFMEEMVRYSEGLAHTSHGGAGGVSAAPTRLFSIDNFIDRTRGEGRFDFSEWVRAYGKYLDEQLTVYAKLRWYVEMEVPGAESRMRKLPPKDLLFQLPHLQRLQRRLLDCTPKGPAARDPVVLFSLALVVKESFKLYKAVSEGVINLADAFFEMELHDATRGLEYYKEGMAASEALSGYYTTIEQLEEIKRTMQLPKLSTPPADFLRSMEAYLAEAPRTAITPEGEAAPQPTKKGVPLRKGRLLSSKSGAGAAAAVAPAAPRDPGMVLPVPSAFAAGTPSTAAGTAQEASSSGSPSASAADSSAAAAAAGSKDLLGGDSQPSTATAASAGEASQKVSTPAPSPLDLLSGLDFSFDAPAVPLAVPPTANGAWAAAGGAVPGAPASAAAPSFSSNPFADVPLAAAPLSAPTSAPPPGPHMQHMQTAGSGNNPFGDPMPSPATAAAAGNGSGGFSWPAAPPSPGLAAPPAHQPAWAAHPSHPPQTGAMFGQPPFTPAPSPAHSMLPAAPPSDDPFAGFGAPSPAVAPAPGGFWASSPASAASYGAAPSPRPTGLASAGDELSKAALHDPFAALTGLPPKNSPGGGSGNRASPRAGF